MARFIEKGKSIFIPFKNGLSITDSQLHLRMYKTVEMFKRYFPKGEEYDVLCEYAPVVRCKDCRWRKGKLCYMISGCGVPVGTGDDFFCSYGERKGNEKD